MPEIVFDLGFMLQGNSLADARGGCASGWLKHPHSAILMANFGRFMLQKQSFVEAEYPFNRAYSMRLSLPDSGRRTAMLLHELRRRANKAPERADKPRFAIHRGQ